MKKDYKIWNNQKGKNDSLGIGEGDWAPWNR